MPSGVLLTSRGNYEANVAVGSVQWNSETTSGGAKVIGGELGALLAALEPYICAGSTICQVNLRAYRGGAGGLAVPSLCMPGISPFGAGPACGGEEPPPDQDRTRGRVREHSRERICL